jgi:hypothetical protein
MRFQTSDIETLVRWPAPVDLLRYERHHLTSPRRPTSAGFNHGDFFDRALVLSISGRTEKNMETMDS